MSARRDPFNGPEEHASSWLAALSIDLTDEQRQRARRKVASDARDGDDCRLLLAALGLDRP
ncbi:hypothetical protein [Kitasatospora cineracea]|uniref:Uncharacterized protein n=1 Tax=Kitasatospora cineracea TaxID=88074 RepID=A0A3N4RQ52_9ACTN|nr:hypothetical protein [Kitasatospora cineracea]RPE34966.1 hypothetical protein EDD38_3309 [Kitasatospora cineracea]